jgi:hypothetical protein
MLFGSKRAPQSFPAKLGHPRKVQSHRSLRNAVRVGKSLVGKLTSKVSSVHLRKPPQEDLNDSTRPLSGSSNTLSVSVVSTAPTTPSLPVLDCGAQFTVPGFDTINNIITQDFKVALDTEAEPSNGFDHNIKQHHYPHQGHVTVLDSTVEQTQKHVQLLSRADSALDLCSTLDSSSTNDEVSEPKRRQRWRKCGGGVIL